ncbi:GntR family transcriptional regulator [Nocardioides caldifontis]|uniref:GntR family transcriptional regulator n=1 Tax=Nocardioides caldifontis TaxID=2588938 RepID=UPI0011DFF215|nr:GntR family transcriptional regulator [Nocardioides caldifontis]
MVDATARRRAAPPRSGPELLQHSQLRDIVYERLREGIIDGSHDVGSTLREQEIAKGFGVSKTPVREAFAKLANDGLVRLVPYRGAVVTDYQPDDLADISGIRQLVEGACAALAARDRTEAQLAAMRDNLAATDEALEAGATEQVLTLFLELDDIIYGFSSNQWVQELVTKLGAHQRRILRLTARIPGRMAESARQHRGIVAAIEEQDQEAAELLTREHVASVMAAHWEALHPSS